MDRPTQRSNLGLPKKSRKENHRMNREKGTVCVLVRCLRRNLLEGPGAVIFLPPLGNKVWRVAGSNMLMVPARSPCTRLPALMRTHCWGEDPRGVAVQGEQETEGEDTGKENLRSFTERI